jgi:hypothetical protein
MPLLFNVGLYREILERLDPAAVRDRLLGFGDRPIMLCWESAADCDSGTRWCHRHIVAQWLEGEAMVPTFIPPSLPCSPIAARLISSSMLL